ncbi:MAG: hypothetical protein AAF497_02595 [Planctomycetota bacterium]
METGETYELNLNISQASGPDTISVELSDGTVVVSDLRGSLGAQTYSFVYDGIATGLVFNTGLDGVLEFENLALLERSTGDILASTNIFTGDAQAATITIEAVADLPALNVASTTTSDEGETVFDVTASLSDNDGSESLVLAVTDIPEGFVLTDGVNEFAATTFQDSVEITAWDLQSLRLIAPASLTESATDQSVLIVATSTEGANGDTNSATETIIVFEASEASLVVPVDNVDDTLISREGTNLVANQNDPVLDESPERVDTEVDTVAQLEDSSDDDREEFNSNADDSELSPTVELAATEEGPGVGRTNVERSDEDELQIVNLYHSQLVASGGSGRTSEQPPVAEGNAPKAPVVSDSPIQDQIADVSTAVLQTVSVASYVISPNLPVATAFNSGKLWAEVDSIVEDSEAAAMAEKVVAGAAVVLVVGFSTGQLLWLLRGTTLITKLMTSMPIWISFDPLPLLDTMPELPNCLDHRGNESLAEIAGAVSA